MIYARHSPRFRNGYFPQLAAVIGCIISFQREAAALRPTQLVPKRQTSLGVMADVGTSNILSRDWSEALPPSRGRLGHEIRALREIESIWEFGMRHYLEAQPTNLAGRDLNPAVEGI
jgi:hypothetical protein